MTDGLKSLFDYDYICFEEKCYNPTAEPFPGVSWRELKSRWNSWWDYPCLYYTEEALLSMTLDHLEYTKMYCEEDLYYWDYYYNGWYIQYILYVDYRYGLYRYSLDTPRLANFTLTNDSGGICVCSTFTLFRD